MSVVFPTRRGPIIAVIRSLSSWSTSSPNSSLRSDCSKTMGTLPVFHHSLTSCRYRMDSIEQDMILKSFIDIHYIQQKADFLSSTLDKKTIYYPIYSTKGLH